MNYPGKFYNLKQLSVVYTFRIIWIEFQKRDLPWRESYVIIGYYYYLLNPVFL